MLAQEALGTSSTSPADVAVTVGGVSDSDGASICTDGAQSVRTRQDTGPVLSPLLPRGVVDIIAGLLERDPAARMGLEEAIARLDGEVMGEHVQGVNMFKLVVKSGRALHTFCVVGLSKLEQPSQYLEYRMRCRLDTVGEVGVGDAGFLACPRRV